MIAPPAERFRRASLRQIFEYLALRALVAGMRRLPRTAARKFGAGLAVIIFHLSRKLREVGRRNLLLAYAEWPTNKRERVLKDAFRSLGWQLAEFCRMGRYTLPQASAFIRYDGLDHYLRAREEGRGVLVVTGHLGAWELSSFYHSLAGHPMSLVIRRLDNPLVDAFVNRIRCLHGNRVIHKDDFARGLISAMRAGETVGILMDTNMTPPQGVFVPFFGHSACTASGLARVALKTDAAVLPGFLLWNETSGQYVLHFGERLQLIRTGDVAADVLTNTARFTTAIETAIRAVPEQWLWMHRRWKTRPPGESSVYS